MTTITATIENNSYWNNIPFDQLFDIDQFLTSDLDFTPFDDDDQSYILMEEEHERTSSSSQSGVNYIFIILHNINNLFTRLIAINHKHYHPIIPHSKPPSRI
jgi:hypothetical protein